MAQLTSLKLPPITEPESNQQKLTPLKDILLKIQMTPPLTSNRVDKASRFRVVRSQPTSFPQAVVDPLQFPVRTCPAPLSACRPSHTQFVNSTLVSGSGCCHALSPGSSRHRSSLSAKSSSRSTSSPSASNKPYSEEEGCFIRYMREDLDLGWAEVVSRFNARYRSKPGDMPAGASGLQGKLYRLNKDVPRYYDDGRPQVDDAGLVVRGELSVRDAERSRKASAAGVRCDDDVGGVGLAHPAANWRHALTSVAPEAALTYDWVSEEDKARARHTLEKFEIARREKLGL